MTKVALSAFAASILVGALASTAMAQNNPVANFDQGYLDHHPDVAQQLSNNPGLVDDPQFMQSHQGLRRYLAHHPEVRTQLKQNPAGFMSSESQFNGTSGDTSPIGRNGRGPAERFDRGYLDKHPEVAEQLSNNPSLANNPQFMTNHPGLQKYLANHPQAQQNLQNHPNGFMERADRPEGWRDRGNRDNFRDKFEDHPNAAQRWQSNPHRLMRREDHFRRNH